MPGQDTNIALTAALEDIAVQPRVQQTIFTNILEPAATPRVTNSSKRLVVLCTQAVVVSNVPTITQEEDNHEAPKPARPSPQSQPPINPEKENPATNTRNRRQIRTLTQEAMLPCI